MKLVAALLVLTLGTCPLLAEDNAVRFEKYGFAIQTPKGWHVADAQVAKFFSVVTHKGVVAHAKLADPKLDAAAVESEVLLLVSKHPLGAKEDNPNVTVSAEKSWSPGPQNTGATYLKLLAERFTLLKAPSQMKDEPLKAEFGGVPFFMQDAANDRVPDATTRQQHITAYVDGYFLTFTISYNDKKDPDYQSMKAMVESFTKLKKEVRPVAAGDGKSTPKL